MNVEVEVEAEVCVCGMRKEGRMRAEMPMRSTSGVGAWSWAGSPEGTTIPKKNTRLPGVDEVGPRVLIRYLTGPG